MKFPMRSRHFGQQSRLFATRRFGMDSMQELVLFLHEFWVWQYSVNIRGTDTIPSMHNI